MKMSKPSFNRPTLVMLYGFPGAGKTFFARQLCDSLNAAHVHGDRIRHELFEQPRHDANEDEVISHLTEYMTEEEHKNLGKVILNRQKWVLSYDDSDIIRGIYQDCDIYNTDGKYCINGAKTEWSRKNELIIIPKS